ncbi:MAG: DNA methyltransferase, partial [Burkholderiales bacterium]
HYTSETNILKLIRPLFLDDLREEFERVKGNKDKLFEFHKKLNRLTFLDPACGCGNFLVISYRELRRLEVDVLRAAERFGQRLGRVFQALKVDVDQFYGIEIEEFPAQVAQVAMWLTDHQMNVEASEVFGEQVLRIPLEKSANIRHGNALQIDWAEFVPPVRLNYILGNPPFVGKQHQSNEQKLDLQTITEGVNNSGLLDYVAGWYVKTARYLTTEKGFSDVVAQAASGRKQFKDVRFGKGENAVADLFVDADYVEVRARRAVKCGFVSTNSITQGEQVGVLWGWMLAQGIRIHFAHRTFQWMNEAPGKAAVHCVIIGFAAFEPEKKRLFEYAVVKGEPHELSARNINPYLVDAPDVVLDSRRDPILPVPPIIFGNMPNDDGNLLLSDEECRTLLEAEPGAEKWVRQFVGADDFLNGVPRWCLWLVDIPPTELKRLPQVSARV